MSLAIDAVASECVAMAASLGSSSGPCLHGCELILAAVKVVKGWWKFCACDTHQLTNWNTITPSRVRAILPLCSPDRQEKAKASLQQYRHYFTGKLYGKTEQPLVERTWATGPDNDVVGACNLDTRI